MRAGLDNTDGGCMVKAHRPVIVKRAVVGSKGGWKLSTIFKLRVFHDLSIIKLREMYF